MAPVVVDVFHELVEQVAVAQELRRFGQHPWNQVDIQFEDVLEGLHQHLDIFVFDDTGIENADEIGITMIQVAHTATNDLEKEFARKEFVGRFTYAILGTDHDFIPYDTMRPEMFHIHLPELHELKKTQLYVNYQDSVPPCDTKSTI